jgi:RHS repeat-associated protein
MIGGSAVTRRDPLGGLWALLLAVMLMAPLAALPQAARAQAAYTTYSRYDSFQRVTGMIHPVLPAGTWQAERLTYDARGNVTLKEIGYLTAFQGASVAPSAWTGFVLVRSEASVYDAFSHKQQVLVAGGGTTYGINQYTYDTVERLKCTAQRMNLGSPPAAGSDACALGTTGSYGQDRINKLTYDSIGRVTLEQRAFATTSPNLQQNYLANTYGADGELATVTDANSNLTQYAYDGFDRLSQVNYPATAVSSTATTTTGTGASNASDYETYNYDPNNNRTSVRRRDGVTITYAYDALNRVKVKTAPGERTVYTSYDLLSRPTVVAFDIATTGPGVAYAYDSAGRLASETTYGLATQYHYDLDGDRTQVKWPDLVTADYQYGNVGQVTAILENNATNLVSFGYGAFGRRNSLTRPNGVTTSYGYDPVSRLTSLAQDLAGTTYDQTLAFAYSPASQVTNRTTTNVAYAWPRLFTVDRPYGVNGLNQLTSAASAPISYDARGNLVNDNALTYGYDVENHLTNVSNGEALVYDPLGRLYQTTNGSGTVTRYLYAGTEIIGELDGSNNLLRRYVHGPGTDEPLVLYPSASTATKQWLIADHQGSIVAVTDATGAPYVVPATGTRAINTYDDYGVPGVANYGLYGYTGQIWLADIGLYHYKARAYSPVLGRFMQTDTVGYKDGPNWYAYVGDDPVDGVDPTGTQAINFDPKVDPKTVSDHSIAVTKTDAQNAKVTSLTITSTQRDARQQAGAMYHNVVAHGAASQNKLYNATARQVVAVAAAGIKAGQSASATQAAMVAKIQDIRAADPSKFAHVADPSKVQAIDISPGSVRGDTASPISSLTTSFRNDSSISRVFDASNGDPAIHIEIPQPQSPN